MINHGNIAHNNSAEDDYIQEEKGFKVFKFTYTMTPPNGGDDLHYNAVLMAENRIDAERYIHKAAGKSKVQISQLSHLTNVNVIVPELVDKILEWNKHKVKTPGRPAGAKNKK